MPLKGRTCLTNDLIDSPAMLTLASCKSGYPLLVYLHFLQMRRTPSAGKGRKKKSHERKNEFINTRELTFAYSAAQKLGIGTRAFNLAIDKLMEYGFIDIVEPGNGLSKGDCTIYGLSDRWRDYGTPNFKPASRTKVRFGFCDKGKKKPEVQAESKTDCSNCLQTGGGQFPECLLPGQPARIDGRCQRFERWI